MCTEGVQLHSTQAAFRFFFAHLHGRAQQHAPEKGVGGGAGAARDVGEPGDGARERGFRRNVGQPRRSACASQPANQRT